MKRNILAILLSGIIIFIAYITQDNTAEKEFDHYGEFIDRIRADLEELEDITGHYIDLIYEGQSLEGLDVLENTYLPKMEAFLDELADLSYDYEPLKEIVQYQRESYEKQYQAYKFLQENLRYMADHPPEDEKVPIDLPHDISEMVDQLDQSREAHQKEITALIQVAVEDFDADEESLATFEEVEPLTERDREGITLLLEEITELFILGLMDSSDTVLDPADDSKEQAEEADEQSKTTADKTVDQGITLADKGHPYVILEAEAEFDEHLIVTGKSNLLEGEKVKVNAKLFGLNYPYIKEEAEIDEAGEFIVDIQMIEEEFTHEPLELIVSYRPNDELSDIYGVEGENIEGPLAQMQKDMFQQVRTNAVLSAELRLTDGEKAVFEPIPHNPPEDQGELDIWIEPTLVKTHDDYYEIELATNLVPLTGINIDIEIPNHRTAGYKSYGWTRDDGSVRYHVKRLEDREIEKNEDVTFVVTAVADDSLHSIEYYGLYGENFEGDLVEKLKKGKRIVYHFKLADYQ